MTRATIAVTTYGQRIVCDACGLVLYTSRVDRLDKRGWVVVEGEDLCPGCRDSERIKKEGDGALNLEYK